MSPSDISSSLQKQDQHKDQSSNATTPTTIDTDIEFVEKVDPCDIMKYPFASYTELGFAKLWKTLMKDNPHAEIPKGWESMWVSDFKKLLLSVTPQELADIIAVTQLKEKQEYWVRPLKLIEQLPLCKTMVKERRKALSAIRVEFKKRVARLEKPSPVPHESQTTSFNIEGNEDELS